MLCNTVLRLSIPILILCLTRISTGDQTQATPSAPKKVRCFDFFSMHNKANGQVHCLGVFFSYNATWQVAAETCSQFAGAHLLSISTDDEVQSLRQAIAETNSTVNTYPKMLRANISSLWVGLGQVCPNLNTKERPDLRWTDGSDFDNKAMKIGSYTVKQPEKADWTKQYCLAFNSNNEASKKESFVLAECSEPRYFVCQMPPINSILDDGGFDDEKDAAEDDSKRTGTKEYPCGKDPFYCALKDSADKTTCYHLLNKRLVWLHAREACQEDFDSDLASVHSKDEMTFIDSMTRLQPSLPGQTKYWIGLHRRNSNRQYEWSDGSSFDYLSMRDVDDDEASENGACMALRTNASSRAYGRTLMKHSQMLKQEQTALAWTNQRCDSKRLAICQKPAFGSKSAETSKKESLKGLQNFWKCPDDFKQYRGMCYGVFGNQSGFNFVDAKAACKKKDSTLVSLTDFYEQGFVLSQLHKINQDAWIGMDLTDGQLRWLDEEPIHMIRFSPDITVFKSSDGTHVFQTPRLLGNAREACVSLDATKMPGYWDLTINGTSRRKPKNGVKELDCVTKKLPYICEKFAEKTDEAPSTDPVCYSDRNNTFCFLNADKDAKVDGLGTFEEGNKACANRAKSLPVGSSKTLNYGQLAVANDLFEWSLLTSLARERGINEFYLGVTFNKAQGKFLSTDGRMLNLAPWGRGEPNFESGNCVVVKVAKNGPYWAMSSCSDRKEVVCSLFEDKPNADNSTVSCPKGKENWILGTTHCYLTVTDSIAPGYKADHDCFAKYQANLASFQTAEDLKAFKNFQETKQLAVSTAYIGLVKQAGDTFVWKDFAPVAFTNWQENEPSANPVPNIRDLLECVYMDLKDFKWRTSQCLTNRHYICSVPVDGLKGREYMALMEEAEDDEAEEPTTTLEPQTSEATESSAQPTNATDSTPGSTVTTSGGKDQQKSRVSAAGPIIGTLLGLAVAGALIGLYIKKRREIIRAGEGQFMQFDSVQNEDDYGL